MTTLDRRHLLAMATAWSGGIAASMAAGSDALAAACAKPTDMDGFKTCADVDAATKEGEVVVYLPDAEEGTSILLQAFRKQFPKIKTNYVRLQTGALYARILAERRARNNLADVICLSDPAMAIDLQKRNGFSLYVSPETAAYKPEYQSQPAGYFTWGSINFAGIVYNPNFVSPKEAPKTWEDLLDPKWTGAISVKAVTSGLQHIHWYELRQLYGDGYWKQIAKLKPNAFDSTIGQDDQLVNGQSKVANCAQYSHYLNYKFNKGAPLAFVVPEAGMTGGPEVWGVADSAPHPQAARLFVDWLLSVPGQKAMVEGFLSHSPREDVPPPVGGLPISKIKILFPSDWQKFQESHAEFVRVWGEVTGLK